MCVSSEVIANLLVLTQLRCAAHVVSYVVVSSENNFDIAMDGTGVKRS
jgi:hypothetical protein